MLMAFDENDNAVPGFGPLPSNAKFFANTAFKNKFSLSGMSSNILVWPKSKKTSDSQHVFWSQKRAINFEEEIKEQYNTELKYVEAPPFSTGGYMLGMYVAPKAFGTWAVDNQRITPGLMDLAEALGLYSALGLTRGDTTVTEPGAEGPITIDNLEAWLRGFDQSGHMKDQKPYICICELIFYQNKNQRYYFDEQGHRQYKLDRNNVHEYFFNTPVKGSFEPAKDGINSQSAYNNAAAKAATGDTTGAAIVSQLNKAMAKLGSVIKNTGIVSGWMMSSSSGGGGGGEDPVPIIANIDIKNSLDMILFEDELSYNYSLLSSGGIKLQAEGQAANKPVGNKVVNITGSVSPHGPDSTCSLGSRLNGCKNKISINTTLSLKRVFNVVDNLVGFMFPNSGILGSDSATTTDAINAKNSEGKEFSLTIKEEPQGTVNTYYFGGLNDPYYLNLDQRVEGFRTIWKDLRTLWPMQTDTNATTDMNRIKVIVGNGQYQNLPGGGLDYYLNTYAGTPGTYLNATNNGSLIEPWSLTWSSTISPTTEKCTGKYKIDAGCHTETTESGGTRRVHEHEDKDCEAVLTLNTPDMNEINNLSNKTFTQYYEVGEANVGSEIVPKQSTYKNFNRSRNKNIRVTVYEYN